MIAAPHDALSNCADEHNHLVHRGPLFKCPEGLSLCALWTQHLAWMQRARRPNSTPACIGLATRCGDHQADQELHYTTTEA